LLANQTQAAPICIDTRSGSYQGLSLIGDAAAKDIEMLTGTRPEVKKLASDTLPNDPVIIVAGTLDDPLIKAQNLTWEIKSSGEKFKSTEWERYQIQVVESSSQIKIVVAGSDKRGAIYGLFHITQDLGGVSPWVWWGDVVPKQQGTLSFTKSELETVSKTPSVKYRGIFLNNEAPSLSTYVYNRFGNYNYLFYDNVFELLLRLKANYLWPAMWNNSFSDDGILSIGNAKDKSNQEKLPANERDTLANARLADKYGVVIGLSHHEPMYRAGVEWQRLQGRNTYNKPTLQGAAKNLWNYFLNADNIYDFWSDGIERNKIFSNNLATIGMRGEGDTKLVDETGKPFGLQENVDLLKKVITDQKQILKDQGQEDVPQQLALYTEVQQYWYGYDEENPGAGQVEGLNQWDVLEDDIIVLCDDNHNYVRFLTYDDERDRNWGMYYHFDMNGGAHSYKWINTVPLQRVWDNMTMCYDYGVDDLWIVNVGDLKPLEVPISYYMDLGYDFEKWGTDNPNSTEEYTEQWMKQQFGAALNDNELGEVANILTDYANMNGNRKPEILYSDTFSNVNYNEAQKELAKAIALEESAEKYWQKLKDTPYKDAYYQLVYYPAMGTSYVNQMMIYQGLNQYYAAKGSTVANTYAKLVNEMIQKDKDILAYYNRQMSSGKWNGMMNQTEHVAYKGWQDTSGAYPVPVNVVPAPGSVLQVGIPNLDGTLKYGEANLPDFENTEKQQYPVTLTNGGDSPVDYEITKSDDWILLTGEGKGSYYTAKSLGIYIDWSKVSQNMSGTVTITNKNDGQTVTLHVNAKVLDTNGLTDKTYLASNGIIGIEANNYTFKKAAAGTEWKNIEDYGKWGTTMKMYPTTSFFDAENPQNAPYMEYSVYVPEDGKYTLTGCFGQSNNVLPKGALRYGIQID
ncbi:MAG: glycosyl hydrolase 115 family protein, partial [Lachnoclostridium sp.]|nr:glycosyl hydrolase 115 family protein [Lachnoclostridium sp.]